MLALRRLDKAVIASSDVLEGSSSPTGGSLTSLRLVSLSLES